MKQPLSIIFILFFYSTFSNAQTADTVRNNTLSLELGKTGLIFNLIFDHKFSKTNFGVRLGAGSNIGRFLTLKTVGGGAYYLAGKGNRYFELGVDIQYLIVDEVSDDQKSIPVVYPDYSVKTVYPSLNIGYRAYRKNTIFRIGFSPGLIKGDFIPGGYISYGFTFY